MLYSKHSVRTLSFLTSVLLLLMTIEADAQWVEQELELESGWSSFWLEVDPVPATPGELFSNATLRSIWTFLPDEDAQEGGRWIGHHADAPAVLNTLHRLEGGRGYYVELTDAATVRVKGRPRSRSPALRQGSPVLFGTSVEARNEPAFEEFLSHPNVRGKISSLWKLEGGVHVEVENDARIRGGEAYWLVGAEDSQIPGPIAVSGVADSIHFAPKSGVRRLRLEVPAAEFPRFLSVRALPSAGAPDGERPDAGLGDPRWLEFRDESGEFRPLAGGATMVIDSGETSAELSIRASRDEADQGGLFQALIAVTNPDGNRVLIGTSLETGSIHGIWSGSATLSEVATHSAYGGEFESAPEMHIALLAKIDRDGSVELLDEVRLQKDRDGRQLLQRVRAALFPESVPLEGAPVLSGSSGLLSGTMLLEADHPLNPYRHRYHPEHTSGYSIERKIEVQFTAARPNELPAPEDVSGTATLSGTYSEEISGLSAESIRVRGSFRLRRLAPLSALESTTR